MNDEKKSEKRYKLFVTAMVLLWAACLTNTIVHFISRDFLKGIFFFAFLLVESYYTLMALVSLVYKDYREKTIVLLVLDFVRFIAYIASPAFCIVAFVDNSGIQTIPVAIISLFSHFVFIPYLKKELSNDDD